jgi:nucleoside-diphosphate-sugar epimerase
MRVLIAGATGVLGRRMVKDLRERGHEVMGLARSETSKTAIESLGGSGIEADIFDANMVAKAVGHADVVIHAATSIPTQAKTRLEDWALNDRLRREGTAALTDAAQKIGAQTYVQQSIVWAARPDDDSFFDETTEMKQPGELYASALDGEKIAIGAGSKFGFKTVVLRCGGFYAADARHTRMLAEGLIKRRLPLMGGGTAIQANLHADDAASAFVTAVETGKQGIWHVTDDAPATLKEMLTEFARLLNAPRPRTLPLWLARPFIGKGVIDFFTRSTRTLNTRFKQDFGWAPKFPSYREGLAEVVAEWKLDQPAGSEKAVWSIA